MKYLVSNIAQRNHRKIYNPLDKGKAIFDLDKSQQGWSEFSNIRIGDIVFVINKERRIAVGYEVTNIADGILLGDNPKNGTIIKDTTGGNTRVLFGHPVKRVDKEYSLFVRENHITNPKLNSQTGQMLQGFNCAAFD